VLSKKIDLPKAIKEQVRKIWIFVILETERKASINRAAMDGAAVMTFLRYPSNTATNIERVLRNRTSQVSSNGT
jgi:ribosomal protein L39E